ncbi:MAG: hypothetical protein ACTHYN_12020 [Marinobacter sp.]|uniref:hypothetical protein n=1 Tax=Marinobacter sp. TaxID=50741 RepID=UPI003F983E00
MFNVKRISLSTALVSCALFSSVGHANPMIERMKMAVERQYENGAFEAIADCLGVTEEKILEAAHANLSSCGDSIEEFESCSSNIAEAARVIGVSEEELTKCGEQEDQRRSVSTRNNPAEEKLDALYDKIGDRAPTSSEQKQITALTQEMVAISQKQTEGQLAELVDSIKAHSQNTENLVTLPIYSPSTIVSHSTEEAIKMMPKDELNGVNFLPSAVFESSGNLQEIVDFYKGKLSKLEGKPIDNDSYIFMENLPENFSFLKNYKDTVSRPNILIRKASKAMGSNEGVKSIINITYKPK